MIMMITIFTVAATCALAAIERAHSAAKLKGRIVEVNKRANVGFAAL